MHSRNIHLGVDGVLAVSSGQRIGMIVTIDGPAGTGKSTVSRELAVRLQFRFLDTGAMYRAVAVRCLQQGLTLPDPDAAARIAASTRIEFADSRTFADAVDVTDQLRARTSRRPLL